MKFVFATLLLFFGCGLFGQNTVTLTSDLVRSSTLIVDEDTNFVGNEMVSIVCDGCSPAILVKSGVTATFEGILFPKVYDGWIRVEVGGEARWNSKRMRGFIINKTTD